MAMLAVCLFIASQFYSIYFRLYNHHGPLGFGDSAFYTSRIAYFKEHNLFSRPSLFSVADNYIKNDSSLTVRQFYASHGITWSFMLGKLAAVFNISAEDIFHYNFYGGIVAAAIVLFIILRQIGDGLLNVIVGFLIFSFYSGTGYYHGFFWVVPSFYCLLLWLISIWLFFFYSKWIWFAPFAIFLLLFTHPSGPYSIAILGFALFLNGCLRNELSIALKKVAVLFATPTVYLLIYLILLKNRLTFGVFTSQIDGLIFEGCWPRLTSVACIVVVLSFVVTASIYLKYMLQHKSNAFEKKCAFYMIATLMVISQLLFIYKNSMVESFNNFGYLWENTPFFNYFVGPFLPLTIAGLYFSFINRRYEFVSLLLTSFTGTVVSCFAISSIGARTFLFLNIIWMIVVSYGIQQSILLVFNNGTAMSNWIKKPFQNKKIYLSNILLLLITAGFFSWLFITRLERDFGQKFYNQVSYDAQGIDSFINKKGVAKQIFFVGSLSQANLLLSIDGVWNKKFYNPVMAPPYFGLGFLGNSIVIGKNHKIMGKNRSGIGVYWPPSGKIVLKTGKLQKGNYKIVFDDTSLTNEEMSGIQLEINREGTYKKIEADSKIETVDIQHLTDNAYPPLMLPWYSFVAKHAEELKPGYYTIRQALRCSMDFTLSGSTDKIYLDNTGKILNLMGSIKIYSDFDVEPVVSVDIDTDSAEELDSKTEFIYNSKRSPLLWTDTEYNLQDRSAINTNKPSSILFIQEHNFGDLKIFKPYDKLFDIHNETDYQ